MTFATGIIVGFLIGGAIAYWLGRRSVSDAETIAETLSAKIFSKQAEKILQLAESKLSGKKDVIEGTLRNLKDELSRDVRDMEKIMTDLGKDNAKIGTRLDHAALAIKELSDTTGNLRSTLSSNSIRGQWGERMAEDVLRLSGLIEGINYIKQAQLESGSKPDFTFMLPKNQRLNMDVKFPFNNYQLYAQATTEKDREAYKKEFLKDVRKRLKEVQTRDYINPEEQTVDYVLLFIPNEQIFSFINEVDRSLIDEALKAKTILCSPLSLYAVLAVIRQSMDNFNLEKTSSHMLNLFGAFKQQWEKFQESMDKMGRRLTEASDEFTALSTTRKKQLERPLEAIEELRMQRGIEVKALDESVEEIKNKATRKLIAARD